ncbi:MAG TPA: Hsp20/alpha crystallin family protein [Candidatus Limnocylindrales bacterium]|nr:Hsp20/alpha crystallin family protein [Candidatus Limnocylindrales bacterium]
MAITRWNPVRDEMTRFVDEFLGRGIDSEAPRVRQPRVDVEESEAAYVVRAELPGMKLEDISITIEDNQLSIRGEKRRDEENKGTTYHRVERVYGVFERSFALGHLVDESRIEALYKNGVLELSIPKSEQAKAREIPVKVAK